MTELTASEVPIRTDEDIVLARRTVRNAATALGFGLTDVTRVVTAASELARNVVRYAGEGVMRLHLLREGDRAGLELVFADTGPGIPDIQQALEPGYTTGRGFGMGLPGARRLVDELRIESSVGSGTTVTIRKWHGA